MGGTIEESWFDSRKGKEILFFEMSGLFLGSTKIFIFSRQEGVLPGWYGVRVVNVATHTHLVSRQTMRGVIPELHHTPSWRAHVTYRLASTFFDTDITVPDQVNVWVFKLRRCENACKRGQFNAYAVTVY